MAVPYIVLHGTLRNNKCMQTIKIIENIIIKDGILHTYGRDGEITKVFLRQGNLEGRCAVYSLMMLLMFHGILNREDLLSKVSADAPEYIKKLKRQFSYCTTIGYSLEELRIKLLHSFNNKLPVEVYVVRKRDEDNLKKIHHMIKEQLDTGYPVQIGLWNPQGKTGHSVVAIGYSLFGTTLRLFCLDSVCPLSYASIWNNIIDVNVDYDDVDKLDFNHQANEKVLVDAMLLIDGWKWLSSAILPFELEENDSYLPF